MPPDLAKGAGSDEQCVQTVIVSQDPLFGKAFRGQSGMPQDQSNGVKGIHKCSDAKSRPERMYLGIYSCEAVNHEVWLRVLRRSKKP